MGDSLSGQAILRELGTEVQRPRTDLGGSEDSLGLLVVSGWSPLLWGLFWSSVFVLCLPFWGLFLDFSPPCPLGKEVGCCWMVLASQP